MNSGILQIHKELEEAASLSGARPWRTGLKIYLPLLAPTFVGVWIWVLLHAVHIAGMPLLLYQGPNHQVLSILLWNMWDDGYVGAVAAIGCLFMLSLLLLALIARRVGFGRHKVFGGEG
jgi:iron(III) transport system permease protein